MTKDEMMRKWVKSTENREDKLTQAIDEITNENTKEEEQEKICLNDIEVLKVKEIIKIFEEKINLIFRNFEVINDKIDNYIIYWSSIRNSKYNKHLFDAESNFGIIVDELVERCIESYFLNNNLNVDSRQYYDFLQILYKCDKCPSDENIVRYLSTLGYKKNIKDARGLKEIAFLNGILYFKTNCKWLAIKKDLLKYYMEEINK